MQDFHHRPPPRAATFRPSILQLDLSQRRLLEEQVELRWFHEPRHSLLCYCASVTLVAGLGLGGVGLLLSATAADSLSGEWRFGVGTALCLLALAVLLKQLLSSAVQDANCVRSRRGIDRLRSGGRADPALILATGLAVLLCGTALLCVAGGVQNNRGQWRDMLPYGLGLVAAGGGVALAVAAYYTGLVFLHRRREERRRRRVAEMRRRRMRRGPGSRAVRVFSVSGGQTGQVLPPSSRTCPV